jgi:putative transposase
VLVAELCRENGMSAASFYKWRATFGGMDASLSAAMKDMAEQHRRLNKMYAEMSMHNELLKEALGNVLRPSQRRELAMKAVAQNGGSVALACRTFRINETCYRYRPTLSDENEEYPYWQVRYSTHFR